MTNLNFQVEIVHTFSFVKMGGEKGRRRRKRKVMLLVVVVVDGGGGCGQKNTGQHTKQHLQLARGKRTFK